MESVTLLTNLKPKEKNLLHLHREGINLMFISSQCFKFIYIEQAHHRVNANAKTAYTHSFGITRQNALRLTVLQDK